MSGEVDGGHHLGIDLLGAVGRLDGEVCLRVEVGGTHTAVAEVGRCAEDAVAAFACFQSSAVSHDSCRHALVGICGVAVGQLLTEEDIVVGPDGRPAVFLLLIAIFILDLSLPIAFILVGRDDTTSIAEVAVLEAVLDVCKTNFLSIDVARRAVVRVAIVVLHVLKHWLVVIADGEVTVSHLALTRRNSLVAVAFVQVEVVQVVGKFTVVESMFGHWRRLAGRVIAGSAGIVGTLVVVVVVAVDSLVDVVADRIAATEDCLGAGGKTAGRTGLHPAALHIASTRVGHAGAGERTCDAQVIDAAAEVTEKRTCRSRGWCEATDGMTIAVECSEEAVFAWRVRRAATAYRRPRARMFDVGT